MTATPIPRTVAMTVFGDLEITVLRERPAGRAPVETHVVPASNAAWMERVWARVREEVANGRRAYVVCARIDPADVDTEDVADDAPAEPPERAALHSVLDVAQEISTRPGFAGIGVGVMHGRLSSEAKDDAMARFADGRDPVLVATTVIEVGVDVPAATIMVVLDADNFGMSQLHQLRGRVGRSDLPSVCLLVSQAPDGSLAAERLAALASTSDGFELAEKDLLLRREGDVLGVAQSGGRNSLRLLSVVHDGELIASARADADAVVAEDPSLAEHPALAAAIESMLGERETFLEKN
jgi:ATP-dependent DNA helicase RecG